MPRGQRQGPLLEQPMVGEWGGSPGGRRNMATAGGAGQASRGASKGKQIELGGHTYSTKEAGSPVLSPGVRSLPLLAVGSEAGRCLPSEPRFPEMGMAVIRGGHSAWLPGMQPVFRACLLVFVTGYSVHRQVSFRY